MKKICSLITLFALLATAMLSLASCGDDSDTPDGMQLVAGSSALGYYFYAPEEWSVSNVGDVKMAYVSTLDTSAVSFVEVDPTQTMPEGLSVSVEDYFFGSYFKDSLAEYPTDIKLSISNTDGVDVAFGKEGESARRAKRYTFTYEHSGTNFAFMQILLTANGKYYIFQYSALAEEKNDGVTYYDHYLGTEEKPGKAMQVMQEFRFVEPTEAEEAVKEYKKDSDGYILISDKTLSGFKLYVPESYEVDYSSAIVSATRADGTNISLTKATGSNVTINDYMQLRFNELTYIVDDLEYKEITDKDGNTSIAYEAIKFGNADTAWAYEYSFTYNRTGYRVYQVLVIEGNALFSDGYVFTYTAKEANYDLHFEEIEAIISKVDFK